MKVVAKTLQSRALWSTVAVGIAAAALVSALHSWGVTWQEIGRVAYWLGLVLAFSFGIGIFIYNADAGTRDRK